MAYGDETEGEKEERFATEQATRERRAQEREIKKQRRQALNQAQGTSQRREIKKAAEEAILKINGFSSSGGNQKGGIYDLSTDNYSQPERNQTNQDVSTEEAGIDTLGGSGDSDSVGGGSGSGESYAFRVVDKADGTVSVETGTVNTVTATGLTPSGKPTELWLKVTFDTDGVVTAASVQQSSGTTSETEDYRQIASITWNGDTPTIVQGIKGSQSIASCGATHQWGTLYS